MSDAPRLSLRVAHLTNALVWDGTGHTNSTAELAMEQAHRGHEVTMICGTSDRRMVDLLETHGVRVVTGFDCSTLGATWRASRRLRLLVGDFDVLHLHTVRSTLLAALASPRAFRRRTLSTLHNPHQRSAMLMCAAARVVTLNTRDRDRVTRLSLGRRRPVVINNGMVGGRRLPRVDDVAPVELPPHSILFTGALHTRKGLDVLLRAVPLVRQRAPDAQLFVIGNRDNPAMERLAHDLGLGGAVHFVGFVDDPRSYMKSAAVFVLPSRVEGFGNVLLEARSAGVPIVASDVGGIPEALAGGSAGWLVPADDVDALAGAVSTVLLDGTRSDALRTAALLDVEDASVQRASQEYDVVLRGLPSR